MRNAIRVISGIVHVEPGVIDEAAITCFTRGQCHALALAIHEQTGWPLIQAGWDEKSGPDHWLVRHPSGKLLDITGLSDESEVCEFWGKVWPGSVEDLDHVWNDRSFGYAEPLMGNARSFVDVVLSTYITDNKEVKA